MGGWGGSGPDRKWSLVLLRVQSFACVFSWFVFNDNEQEAPTTPHVELYDQAAGFDTRKIETQTELLRSPGQCSAKDPNGLNLKRPLTSS